MSFKVKWKGKKTMAKDLETVVERYYLRRSQSS